MFLKRAADDWLFLEELLIALIHPNLRSKTEKARKIESAHMERWHLFQEGFGIAKAKHLFIEWAEGYLSKLVTQAGSQLSSATINRIIKATFEAAFGEAVHLETIKTTLPRLKRKRRRSVQSSRPTRPRMFLFRSPELVTRLCGSDAPRRSREKA